MNNQVQLVLDNLRRALVAEEKHGFTNTSVLGGFSAFLQGIVPRLAPFLPDTAALEFLRQIAPAYGEWGVRQRRKACLGLLQLLDQLKSGQPALMMPEELPPPQQVQPPKLRSIDGLQPPAASPAAAPAPAAAPEQRIETAASRASQQFAGAPASRGDRGEARALQYVKGVGPERAKLLKSLGLETIEDLFYYFPRRYEDRRLHQVEELRDGDVATLAGRVLAGQISQGKPKVVKLTLEVQGRTVQAVWFNQAYILKQYPVGTQVVVSGKVRWRRAVPEILASDVDKADELKSQPEIIPVYSERAGLSTKVLRGIVRSVLPQAERLFPEILPPEDIGGWIRRPEAFREIHFPSSYDALNRARDRLVWEEILLLQLAVARLQRNAERWGSPVLAGGNALVEAFCRQLPYALTGAQQRVIGEIFRDMAGTRGMARLVQGDVGSGKTVVAMAALLQAVGSGYQGAMMAPTEILARQHYESLVKAFTPLGITVECLLGSQSKQERAEILAKIAAGAAKVVVGTHALIQEAVTFKALGLAITDEQHRFGVRQRSLLQTKGDNPHVLVLTATPIPRTLALTLYGDLQLSVIDELPAGRKPILTRKLSEKSRPYLENFLEDQMRQGRQVYVVCPLVEESEALDLASATERAASLQARFAGRRIALMHGRLKAEEKEDIMRAFAGGKIDLLVTTTVVEVGVNVPNATVMVVEGAERFGLAQLHQLRGRVGRGSEQSYCLLVAGSRDSRRLDILCHTQDGFKIAEEDLRLRGPGELLGTRQHGLAELRLADLSRDGRLVEKAYQMAQKVLAAPQRYPDLLRAVDGRFPPDKIGIN